MANKKEDRMKNTIDKEQEEYISKKKDKYVGEWKQGERHGNGTLTELDGDKARGMVTVLLLR